VLRSDKSATRCKAGPRYRLANSPAAACPAPHQDRRSNGLPCLACGIDLGQRGAVYAGELRVTTKPEVAMNDRAKSTSDKCDRSALGIRRNTGVRRHLAGGQPPQPRPDPQPTPLPPIEVPPHPEPQPPLVGKPDGADGSTSPSERAEIARDPAARRIKLWAVQATAG
jgi:hypothetical protein